MPWMVTCGSCCETLQEGTQDECEGAMSFADYCQFCGVSFEFAEPTLISDDDAAMGEDEDE